MPDRLLALALDDHEGGLHSCGHPRSLAWSPLAEAEFTIATATCQACASLEQFQRAERARAGADVTREDASRDGRAVLVLPPGPGARIPAWDGHVHTH